MSTPLPTLGYPSQSAAIVALYLDGIAPSVIARRTDASINSVTRSIRDYRKKTGVDVPVKEPVPRGKKGAGCYQSISRNDWRMRNYLRSIHGARQALEAIGQ